MAFVQFSGVTYHDPDLAWGGYVLYTGADGITRLIDLNGVVRNEWPYPGVPARIIDPALNDGRVGDIGVQLTQLDDSPGGIYANRTVGQLSWTGEKLWEWGTEAPGGAARQNHDWELLENGNRLILVAIPREVAGLGPHVVGDQGVYEVAPDGRIVWEWKAGDHLDEFGFTTEGFEYLRRSVARQPDNIWGYLEINSAKTLGPNRWHREDPDTVFAPDNILISSRKANIVALIDKRTGKIVWRLGPYFDAEPGSEHQRINSHSLPRPLDQISGQHNPHFIADGLPGAGNLLVFDNQGGAGYPPAPLGIYAGSRVLEIDPVTKHIVWQYTAEDSAHRGRSSAHLSATRSACPTGTR
jgi:Arylsulfotransferase (ASST)